MSWDPGDLPSEIMNQEWDACMHCGQGLEGEVVHHADGGASHQECLDEQGEGE